MHGNYICGKISILSLLSLGFLSLFLVTVVTITTNTKILQIFAPKAVDTSYTNLTPPVTSTTDGYGGSTVINANNITPNTVGYDCSKGGCPAGMSSSDVSGYYESNGKYYAVGGTGNDPNTYASTSLAAKNACGGTWTDSGCVTTAPAAPPPAAPAEQPPASLGTTTSGYGKSDVINTSNTIPNTVGYDCSKGGCPPGVIVSGFYQVGNTFYPVGESAGGPSQQQLGYIKTNQANAAAQAAQAQNAVTAVSALSPAPTPASAITTFLTPNQTECKDAAGAGQTSSYSGGKCTISPAPQLEAKTDASCGVGMIAEGSVCRNPKTGAVTNYTDILLYNEAVGVGNQQATIYVNNLCLQKGASCNSNNISTFAQDQLITANPTLYKQSQNTIAAKTASCNSQGGTYNNGNCNLPIAPVNATLASTTLVPNGGGCHNSSDCESGYCGSGGGKGMVVRNCEPNPNPPQTPIPAPIADFAYCENKYGNDSASVNACNGKLTTTYNILSVIPGFGSYVNAYAPDNVNYGWKQMGYSSSADCLQKASGLAKSGCNTYNPTNQQIATSVQVGSEATAAVAAIVTTGGAAGGLISGAVSGTAITGTALLGTVGTAASDILAVQAELSTGTAVSTCIVNGVKTSQCGSAALEGLISWANVLSVGAVSAAGEAYQAVQTARVTATIVSAFNVADTGINAGRSCANKDWSGCVANGVFTIAAGITGAGEASDYLKSAADTNQVLDRLDAYAQSPSEPGGAITPQALPSLAQASDVNAAASGVNTLPVANELAAVAPATVLAPSFVPAEGMISPEDAANLKLLEQNAVTPAQPSDILAAADQNPAVTSGFADLTTESNAAITSQGLPTSPTENLSGVELAQAQVDLAAATTDLNFAATKVGAEFNPTGGNSNPTSPANDLATSNTMAQQLAQSGGPTIQAPNVNTSTGTTVQNIKAPQTNFVGETTTNIMAATGGIVLRDLVGNNTFEPLASGIERDLSGIFSDAITNIPQLVRSWQKNNNPPASN